MMIHIFDVVNNKVVPSVHCYNIPWLKTIMENYPDDYLRVYGYIFYTTCPDPTLNLYMNVQETLREEAIIADLKIDFSLEDLDIMNAVIRCKELYETPVLRTFRGAKKMLDKLATFLDETEISTGKDGNASEIRGMMKEMSTYWENYHKLETVLKEEQVTARGLAHIRYDMMPGYKNKIEVIEDISDEDKQEIERRIKVIEEKKRKEDDDEESTGNYKEINEEE